jgi:hypothetical protein
MILSICAFVADAQFAPPAGQPGSTAVHKDSSAFIAWATGCTVVRGYQDISNTSLGYASVGDSSMALGMAGENGVVSLGDGGYAILTFADPISNGPGWDFAVFENSFSDDFLELAFVEVSSDGINFFRFPATSNTQDTLQIGGFGSLDATKINNLAGKYRASYGTPFDLEELSSQEGLNINAVTHVKVIDVVGCIQDEYATYDQYGKKINDPWNTPFPSGGFDLDAVGVLKPSTTPVQDASDPMLFAIYPNPARGIVFVGNGGGGIKSIAIINGLGQTVKSVTEMNAESLCTIDVSSLPDGIYFVAISDGKVITTKKLIVEND